MDDGNKTDEIRAHFEKLSHTRDYSTRKPTKKLIEIGAFLEAQDLYFEEPASVLDVGCFDGFCSDHLKQHFLPSARMIGIDLSNSAINQALSSSQIDEGYVMDLSDESAQLPFHPVKYAFSLSTTCFLSATGLTTMLGHIENSLQPGGHFVCQNFFRNKVFEDDEINEKFLRRHPLLRFMGHKEKLYSIFENADFIVNKDRTEESIQMPPDSYRGNALFYAQKPF
jgi:SAM-dependent methyltransferase